MRSIVNEVDEGPAPTETEMAMTASVPERVQLTQSNPNGPGRYGCHLEFLKLVLVLHILMMIAAL